LHGRKTVLSPAAQRWNYTIRQGFPGGGGTTDAATPTITTDLTPASNNIYQNGDTAHTLTIAAATSDSGTLSYQWKYNTTNSIEGGTNVGTDSASYTPLTTTNDTFYYFCVVTNTNTSVNGKQTATATSNTVEIIVQATAPETSADPTISDNLSSSEAIYYQGDTVTLSVTASGSGTLTYQWYRNTIASQTGASTISGETTNSYTPSTATTGTVYYAVVVTNTEFGKNPNTKVSNIAMITVVQLTTIADGATITGYSGGAKTKTDLSSGYDEVGAFSIDSSNKLTLKLTDPSGTDLKAAGSLTVLSYYGTGDLSSSTEGAKFDAFTGVTLTSLSGYAITQAVKPSSAGAFKMAIYIYSDTANANLTATSSKVVDAYLTIAPFNLTLAKGWNVVEISGTIPESAAAVAVKNIPYTDANWGWDAY
jgi:hypothetical protein